MKIAYILWYFPALTETFILREMCEAVKKNSVIIDVYANQRRKESKVHPAAQGFISSQTYFPSIYHPSILIANLFFIIYFPWRYLSTLLNVLSFVPEKPFRLRVYFILQTFYSLAKAAYLAKVIKKKNYDFLHVHFLETASHIAMIASMLTGVPFTTTSHAHDLYRNSNKRMIVNIVKNSMFSVTISDYNRKYILYLDKRVQLANKIHVIHCGVDPEEFQPAEKSYPSKFRILTVARFIEMKGIEYLIEACNILKNDFEFHCTIIGEGGLRISYEKLIRNYNLQNVVDLRGDSLQNEIRDEMQKATVFVLPAIVARDNSRDGVPVVLMEAMAMRLPVISTTVSGIPELVKNGSGFLVPPEDVQALARTIKDVYQLNANQCAEMGRKGRLIVENEFNIRDEVEKLVGLWQR